MKFGTKICIIILIILAILLIDLIRKFAIIREIDEQYAKDRVNQNHYYKQINKYHNLQNHYREKFHLR